MRMLKHTWYIHTDLVIDLDNENEMDRVEGSLRTVPKEKGFHHIHHRHDDITRGIRVVHVVWRVDV